MTINALKSLIEDEGYNLADQATFQGQATIVVTLPQQIRGNISFDIMCNLQSVETSSIFFEDKITTTYGIKYKEYQPRWGKMNYCETEHKLHFKNHEYQFYLERISIESSKNNK